MKLNDKKVANKCAQGHELPLGKIEYIRGLVDNDKTKGHQGIDTSHSQAAYGELQYIAHSLPNHHCPLSALVHLLDDIPVLILDNISPDLLGRSQFVVILIQLLIKYRKFLDRFDPRELFVDVLGYL
jgi:hypothetical protein